MESTRLLLKQNIYSTSEYLANNTNLMEEKKLFVDASEFKRTNDHMYRFFKETIFGAKKTPLGWNEFRKQNKNKEWTREQMSQAYQNQISEEDKQHEEDKELLEHPYETCINPQDYIDGQDWTDEDVSDMVFIHDPKVKGEPKYTCYRREYLLQSLHQKSNHLAKWIGAHDAEGHGGHASQDPKDHYIKLIPFRVLVTMNVIQMIDEDERAPSIYELMEETSIGMVKVGNLKGQMGPSNLHGQHPPQPVFTLKEIKQKGIKITHVERMPYQSEAEEKEEEEEVREEFIPEEEEETGGGDGSLEWALDDTSCWQEEGAPNEQGLVTDTVLNKMINAWKRPVKDIRKAAHRKEFMDSLIESIHIFEQELNVELKDISEQESTDIILKSIRLLKTVIPSKRLITLFPYCVFDNLCPLYPEIASNVELLLPHGYPSLDDYIQILSQDNNNFHTYILYARVDE